MEKYKIKFEENGGEYYGILIIECDTFEKIDGEDIIIVNGAKITVDETITEIEKI